MNKALFPIVALFSLTIPLGAVEYFVSPGGNDASAGTHRGTAFRTVQKGLDALEPGDTLTIRPGEYAESVSRKDLGSDAVETTIRAEIPGTVLLRGDVPIENLRKVDGHRFLYEADFPQKPYAVAEADSLTMIERSIYRDELEFVPGSFFYDDAAKKIYLSSTDLRPATDHAYRASITPRTGFLLQSPKRVIIEGLGATGFHFDEILPSTDQFGTRWGILLENPSQCVIRNCTAFLNGGGISLLGDKGAGHNVIEDCRVYANSSKYSPEGGNIEVFHGSGDILRRNYVYLSAGKGQRFYLSTKGNLLMEDTLGWGNATGDLWIKGMREKAGPARADRVVSLSYAPAPDFSRSYVSAGVREEITPSDSLFIAEEKDLDPDQEFADPYHLDFRLQSGSRFRNSGPDGQDRGPFPYTANIFYVRPDGDDAADGSSLRKAWKTLPRAVQALRSGDTLYVSGGTYAEDVTVSASKISIQRRGPDPVILTGRWELPNTNDVALRRMTFTGSVTVSSGKNLTIENCAFVDKAAFSASADGLRLTHNIFAQPLTLMGSRRIFAAGNIFAGDPGIIVDSRQDIFYSGYNAYADGEAAWSEGKTPISLAALQTAGQDFASRVAAPEIAFEGGKVTLRNQGAFAAGGPMGTDIGLYFEAEPRELRTEGPFVHSVSDTTANLEWWTSVPALTEFSWGETPECQNTRELHHQRFASYSLTGLQPGKTYYYRIRVPSAFPGYPLKSWVRADPDRVITGSFTTAEKPNTPRNLYVSTDGNDTATGLTHGTTWKSLNHAAAQAAPGDTIWIAGGDYHETVWIRASGDKDRPITFRAIPGERVNFDGLARQIFSAFVVQGKHHVILDSFYGVNLGQFSGVNGNDLALERGGMFVLAYSDDVAIRRCLNDGRGTGYSPTLVVADSCRNLHMKNCVSIAGYNGPYFFNCPGLRFENSVLFRHLIAQFFAINHSDQPALVANNIFTDGLLVKIKAPTILIGRPASLTEKNNCFFVRKPEEKTVLLIYDDYSFERERAASRMGPNPDKGPVLAEIQRFTLTELAKGFRPTDSLLANPEFAALAKVPAADAKGRPAYAPDLLAPGPADFPMFFATNPEVVRRGIGLIPADFADLVKLSAPEPKHP